MACQKTAQNHDDAVFGIGVLYRQPAKQAAGQGKTNNAGNNQYASTFAVWLLFSDFTPPLQPVLIDKANEESGSN